MPDRHRANPFTGYNFRFEVDGVGEAAFREFSGLTFEVDQVEYRDGDDPYLHARKQYGLRKFTNLQAKRGITTDLQLYNWWQEVLNGPPQLRDGAIVLTDELQVDRLRWSFRNAFITKWEGPSFNATSNDVAIEMIEISVDRVELTLAAA
ncbi:phage tail protein [Roseovarius spongiae]|uniref:Phage tail protein n=1 Tax=Roseovarius spongiae TaxID=2320272 RepID=A0A3A8ATJ9_9RHOB|nr:phage tail protein [Roseovarius spongiae]RKF14894.1 phage tail protein [Roseovarius spongiae]